MSAESGVNTSNGTPPPVEILTRGMISLFSKFAAPNGDAGGGVLAADAAEVQMKQTELNSPPQQTVQEEKPSAYQDFLSKLKALSVEQPSTIQPITDFVNSMKTKQVIEKYPIFDDEDIPGCHEEFAPEVTAFLIQISKDLLRTRFWKGASDEEVLAMKESLEKLIMSRIYQNVFAPTESHRDRDKQLYLKIKRLRHFIDPVKHLDMRTTLDPQSTDLANWEKIAEELAKMSTQKTPRDKLVCIVNACRGLVQYIKSRNESPIPDIFIPCLIYLLVLANPSDLHSNVEYVTAYRGQEFLRGETGHFLLHFASAVSFLWRADGRALSITADEFEQCMGRPMSELANDSNRNNVLAASEASPHSAEWFEERFKYEHVDVTELKVTDVKDLLDQYHLLVEVAKQMLRNMQKDK